MRRYKSKKTELIRKSREAMLSAVQIYNNPQITFKSETYITLAIIAWTYMLHAYYKSKGIDFRYFKFIGKNKKYDRTKGGAYKNWELERCLNDDNCPIDNDTKANLKFLIGIRNEIEHQMTNQIDEYLSAKLQACSINFDFYIVKLFGPKYGLNKDLSLAIQFSPLTSNQKEELLNNEHILSNVHNFIIDFENGLDDSIIRSERYAYRVVFTPINVNRKGQADQVIEFVKSDSPLAGEINKSYVVMKETEKSKYIPSEIVKLMQDEGYIKFTINKHTDFWKTKDAKNPNKGYGTRVAKTWYWYDNWVSAVREHCLNHKDELME